MSDGVTVTDSLIRPDRLCSKVLKQSVDSMDSYNRTPGIGVEIVENLKRSIIHAMEKETPACRRCEFASFETTRRQDRDVIIMMARCMGVQGDGHLKCPDGFSGTVRYNGDVHQRVVNAPEIRGLNHDYVVVDEMNHIPRNKIKFRPPNKDLPQTTTDSW